MEEERDEKLEATKRNKDIRRRIDWNIVELQSNGHVED